MGYEGVDDDAYPNFKKILTEVSSHAHGGTILFMTEALQEYLHMEKNLKELPEHMRMTAEEKLKFESVFLAYKSMKKEFSRNYLKRIVSEVVKAHENDTESDEDEDEGDDLFKSIQL